MELKAKTTVAGGLNFSNSNLLAQPLASGSGRRWVALAAAALDGDALQKRDGGQPMQNNARFRTGWPPRSYSS